MNKYIVALGFAVLAAIYAFFNVNRQPQIEINEGKGWDGVYYERMCEYFKTGKSDEIKAPFGKRVAVPYLASLLPTDSRTAFLVINLSAGALAVFVTALALGHMLRPTGVIACTLPLIFYFFSPIRFAPFYPFTVDPAATFLYALSVLFIVQKRHWCAVLTLSLSIFVRESGFYFAMVLPLVLWLRNELSRKQAISMALLAIAFYVAASFLHLGVPGVSHLKVSAIYIWKKMLNPVELVKVTAGILQTIGPFVILFSLWPRHERPMKGLGLNIESGMFLLALLMACLGGADTTRIFYIAFPLFVVLLARQASGRPLSLLVFITTAGLIANRFLAVVPQPSGAKPANETEGLFVMFPDYAHPAHASVALFYWVIVYVVAKQVNWTAIDSYLGLNKVSVAQEDA
jgi:hypothetical protein